MVRKIYQKMIVIIRIKILKEREKVGHWESRKLVSSEYGGICDPMVGQLISLSSGTREYLNIKKYARYRAKL